MAVEVMLLRWPEDIAIWSMNVLLIFVGFSLLAHNIPDLLLLRQYGLRYITGPYIYVLALLTVSTLGGALLGPLLLISDILVHLDMQNYSIELVLGASRAWLTSSSTLLLCSVSYHRMKTYYGSSHPIKTHNDQINFSSKWWIVKPLVILLLPFGLVMVASITNTYAGIGSCVHNIFDTLTLSVVTIGGICSGIFSIVPMIRIYMPQFVLCNMLKQRTNKVNPYSTSQDDLSQIGEIQANTNVTTMSPVYKYGRRSSQSTSTRIGIGSNSNGGINVNHQGLHQPNTKHRNSITHEPLTSVSVDNVRSSLSSQPDACHRYSSYNSPIYSNMSYNLGVSHGSATSMLGAIHGSAKAMFGASHGSVSSKLCVSNGSAKSRFGGSHGSIKSNPGVLHRSAKSKLGASHRSTKSIDSFASRIGLDDDVDSIDDNIFYERAYGNLFRSNDQNNEIDTVCKCRKNSYGYRKSESLPSDYYSHYAGGTQYKIKCSGLQPPENTDDIAFDDTLDQPNKMNDTSKKPCGERVFSISSGKSIFQPNTQDNRLRNHQLTAGDPRSLATDINEDTTVFGKVMLITEWTGLMTCILCLTQLPSSIIGFPYHFTDFKVFDTVSKYFSMLQLLWFYIAPFIFLLQRNRQIM